jgi:hypothetical protein
MKPTFINNMVINSSVDPHVPDHICIHIGLSHYGAGLVLQLVYYTVIASSTVTPLVMMSFTANRREAFISFRLNALKIDSRL